MDYQPVSTNHISTNLDKSNSTRVSIEDYSPEISSSENDSVLSNNASTGRLLHDATESTRKSKFHHIKDLDKFFKNVYIFHQGDGFFCLFLKTFLQVFQIYFIISFLLVLRYCINFEAIFNNDAESHQPWSIIWNKNCLSNFKIASFYEKSVFITFIFYFIYKLIEAWRFLLNMWLTRKFYESCLEIPSNQMRNYRWNGPNGIQEKLLLTQKKIKFCIQKDELFELDVYHRILRFKNYQIALYNKQLMPSVYLPFLGEVNFLSILLKFSYEILFFKPQFGLFESTYNLKPEITLAGTIATKNLERNIILLASLNLILLPFTLVFQLIYTFFTYADLVKTEPDIFGKRRWTEYSKLKLRHFNELDHEFDERLARAHRPATKYLESFKSPAIIILAEHFSFIFGAILAVMITLTIYDEDVLNIEHALTVIGGLTVVVGVLRTLIPKDDEIICPNTYMKILLQQIHYLPFEWKDKAHTEQVREKLDKLFQLRAVHIVEELLSPVLVPYILFFKLRPKAEEIISFFRKFTTSVQGVGDVCSFSLMNIEKHGDPEWHSSISDKSKNSSSITGPPEDGKLEMSLLRFSVSNPGWRPENVHTKNWISYNAFKETQKSQYSSEKELREILGSDSTMDHFQRDRSFGLQNSDIVTRMNESLYNLQVSKTKRIIKTEEICPNSPTQDHQDPPNTYQDRLPIFNSTNLNLQPSIELSNFESNIK